MKTVRKALKVIPEYVDCEDSDLIEVITECSEVVWTDPYLDEHRWYYLQDVVVEVSGLFIRYSKYGMTGDHCMGDMDLQYNLDDFEVVEKKTRTIEETYYA